MNWTLFWYGYFAVSFVYFFTEATYRILELYREVEVNYKYFTMDMEEEKRRDFLKDFWYLVFLSASLAALWPYPLTKKLGNIIANALYELLKRTWKGD